MPRLADPLPNLSGSFSYYRVIHDLVVRHSVPFNRDSHLLEVGCGWDAVIGGFLHDVDARNLTGMLGDYPLLEQSGVGILTAANLIAETGDVRRFPSADAFAALAGVAPIPASSGQPQRMRLNRGGNRRLNRALYTIATNQAIYHPSAEAHLARKSSEQKSRRDGIQALKRQLLCSVFRLLREGAPALEMAA